jgi:deoxycytidylate deaminase
MKKPIFPSRLAEDILHRSSCHVQVGAVIADHHGIFSWGWNHSGPTGFGIHAEIHALVRANHSRLRGATLYVAGQRRRNGKFVPALPCPECARATAKVGKIVWRDTDGKWRTMR